MKITIITQDEPFFLADNIDYLIRNFPRHSIIVSCVVFKVSPFGKSESFVQKTIRTFRIFGARFFAHYAKNYLLSKMNPAKKVKKVLSRHKIPIIELDKPINTRESLNVISQYGPDLLISIAGNQIFKGALINLAPKGCLNLHTALLPKYRGLLPTFWVLKNNERYTGVSIFYVDEGIDSGPILVQKRVEIGNMTQEQLIRKTKRMGMDAIIEAVDMIEKGNCSLIDNDAVHMSYYKFPTREDVKEFLRIGKRFY